jgi:hypothetical protein
MVMAHFAKRELETMLYVGGPVSSSESCMGPLKRAVPSFFLFSVHRFSHATMPLRNIFKKYVLSLARLNWLIISCYFSSLHYHVLSGIFFHVCYALTKLYHHPQGFSLRIQYMVRHTPQIRRISRVLSGLTSYSYGLVPVSGSYVPFSHFDRRTDRPTINPCFSSRSYPTCAPI